MKKTIFGMFLFLSIFILIGCKDTTFDVSFDLNYETSLLGPATQPIKEGKTATEPMEPSREGFKFIGWFKKDATEKYDFGTVVTSDFKLFAHWEELQEDDIIDFYLAGSFSNYAADDADYAMVKGEDGKYSISVELTEANRDKAYDGHYYKVTDGTWEVCYGVDNYYIDPAPASPTGGGLGSVWHWAEGTLTVIFDAQELTITDTLVIKTPIVRNIGPAIYGKFNSWDLSAETGFYLTDDDKDGIFTGMYEFEEAGTSDFTVCLSEKWYDDQWGQRWGANEQYKFDGTAAGMGASTEITYEIGKYVFSYNSETKITTYEKFVPQAITYEVDFNLNYEGSEDGPEKQVVEEGEKASLPIPKPARDGYEFEGWFKTDATTAYDFNTLVTSDFTLNAHWKLIVETKYYLAGSFNAYSPNNEDYLLVKGEDGKYSISVELTEANRDKTYDGHYYKVTDGTWTNSYGVDNYYINPAPVSPTGGGLGSVWHWADGTLNVIFDAEELAIEDTLVMEEVIERPLGPAIYGKFNTWDLSKETGFHLTDADKDGIYNGTITFTEAGTSDFTVCLSEKWYDDQWGQRWGAEEQYKLDGTPAGMGDASSITYEAGDYFFTYNSNTKVTTYLKVEADSVYTYSYPRLYGAFNGWGLDTDTAFFLTDDDNDGIYSGTINFEEAGTSDFTLCLSKKYYDDEWGKRWGGEEQYKLDGTPAGMGDASSITYEAGDYFFTYNSNTKVTTYLKLEADSVYTYSYPRLYGKFNNWSLDTDAAFFLTDDDKDGIYNGTINFEEAGTSDFTLCLSKKYYDDEWGQRWGAEEQYKLDGTPAGMGDASSITYEAGDYFFTYNSNTRVTTYLKVEAGVLYAYSYPRLYGAFNGWALDTDAAFFLTDEDNDGIYSGTITFEEAGTSDFTLCLSKKYYDDEWGKRWGSEAQYKLDGTPAGMGDASSITYEAGDYFFTYNKATRVTTYLKVEADTVYTYSYPRLYGAFNGWSLDTGTAFLLADDDKDGIYEGIITFEEAGTSDFTLCLSKKYYDDEWGKRWGAAEQYKIDGTPAGMGDASSITYEAGDYFFTYNKATKVTTYVKLEVDYIYTFACPRIYGKFNNWAINSSQAFLLSNAENPSIYTGMIMALETLSSDVTVCLSKKWYDDEYGKRWGAAEQYKFDGTVAGMGNATEITFEVGMNVFEFNFETKITTHTTTEV